MYVQVENNQKVKSKRVTNSVTKKNSRMNERLGNVNPYPRPVMHRKFRFTIEPDNLVNKIKTSTNVLQKKVGLEFQMLTSKVDLYKKNMVVDKLENWKYNNAKWHVEKDGENIEFVTKTFDDQNQVDTALGQIKTTADLVAKAGIHKQDPNKANNQTNRIDVKGTGNNGQPQVNLDISLDRLINNGLPGYTGESDLTKKMYFGAESVFGWQYSSTVNTMEKGEKIRNHVKDLEYGKIVNSIVENSNTGSEKETKKLFGALDENSRRKIELLAKGYILLMATILETAPRKEKLSKDMPWLPKVNLDSFANEIKRITASGNINIELHKDICPDILIRAREALSEQSRDIDFDRGSMIEQDQFSRHVDGVKTPKAIRWNNDIPYILIEYRRMPVVEVSKWNDVAQDAYNRFGNLV